MPNQDGTGPLGKGSKTDRRMGKCVNNNTSQNNVEQNFFGRMRRWYIGGGNGWGRRRNGNGRGQGQSFGNKNQQE